MLGSYSLLLLVYELPSLMSENEKKHALELENKTNYKKKGEMTSKSSSLSQMKSIHILEKIILKTKHLL